MTIDKIIVQDEEGSPFADRVIENGAADKRFEIYLEILEYGFDEGIKVVYPWGDVEYFNFDILHPFYDGKDTMSFTVYGKDKPLIRLETKNE